MAIVFGVELGGETPIHADFKDYPVTYDLFDLFKRFLQSKSHFSSDEAETNPV